MQMTAERDRYKLQIQNEMKKSYTSEDKYNNLAKENEQLKVAKGLADT